MQRDSSRWSAPGAALGLVLSLCFAGPLAAGVQSATELERGFRAPAVQAHRTALEQAGTDAAALRSRLRDLDADQALATPMRERLLVEGLQKMVAVDRDPEGWSLLRTLALREPQTFVTLEDGAHEILVAYADVGAEARRVLARWHGLDARDDAARLITSGRPGALAVFAGDDGDPHLAERRTGVMEALESADASALAGLREEALALVTRSPAAARPVLHIATRLGDVGLAEMAVVHGARSELVRHLPAAAGAFDPETGSRLLIHAAERADLADVAHSALARMADRRPDNLDTLFLALADPVRGAGAAAALARRTGPDLQGTVLGRLTEIARGSEATTARRRALLALYLMDSPGAEQALAAFAGDPDQSDELREVVSSWLR